MKIKGRKIFLIFTLLIALFSVIFVTSGKYIYNSVWNYYLKSKGFYFESDLLNTNTKKNSFLKWDGSDIYFTVKNSLNNELVSEYDISYKISCTVLEEESEYIDCILNGTNSSVYNGSLSSVAKCVNNIDETDVSKLNKADCEINGYTWNNEITLKNNYFNLILKDETKNIDEVSIKITAESSSPYHKTLTGIFNINKVDSEGTELITYYQNFNEYDELSITNTTQNDKCAVINFNADNFLIDLNSTSILEYNTDSNEKVNQISIKIEKQSSNIYKFYKMDGQIETSIYDFIIEEKEC